MADKTIIVRLKAAGVGQFVQNFQTAGGTVQGAAAQIGQAAATSAASAGVVARAAGIAGKALLVGFGAGMVASAKAAIDFESSFAGIIKTVDATEAGFQRLRVGMLELSTAIPIDVHTLNRIGELGGQLDIAEDQLIGFTETIAKLGVTTNLQTETAAIGFARLANVLQVPQDEFENMGSAIVDLGNNFATTEDEILNFATRIAPVGSIVGLTVDQTLALATAFTSVGIPAERGGTAVQKAFSAMAEAVAETGDELDVFGDVAAMTADEFAALFERDAAAAFNRFVLGLGQVEQAGGNVFAILDKVGLGNERTVQSLLAVAGAGDILTRALNTSADAFADNSALTEEAEKRFDTVASKIQLAKNQLYEARVEIGNFLLPTIGEFVEDMGTLISMFANSSTAFKQSAAALTAFLTVALLTFRSLKSGERTLGNFARGFGRRGGIAIAVMAATAVLGEWVKKMADAEQQIREFQGIVADLEEGTITAAEASDAFYDAIVGELTSEDLELFRKFGLNTRTVTDAMVAAKGEGELFLTMLQDLASTWDMFVERWGDPHQFGEIQDIVQRMGGTVQDGEQLGLLARYVYDLEDAYNRMAEAYRRQALLNAEARRAAEDEAYANRARTEAAELAEKQTMQDARAIRERNRALMEYITLTDELLDQARDVWAEENDQAAAVFDYISALRQVVEINHEVEQGEMTRLQALEAQTGAWFALQDAMAALGPEGVQPALRELSQMRQAGVITMQQYEEYVGVMGRFTSSIKNSFMLMVRESIKNADNFAEILNEMGWDLNDLARAGFNTAVSIASDMFKAIQAISAALKYVEDPYEAAFLAQTPGVSAAIRAAGEALERQLGTFENIFAGIGHELALDVAEGIKGGGGAVEDAIQKLIDEATQDLQAATGAIGSAIAGITSAASLSDAEQELFDLRAENLDMARLIAEAEDALTQARERAAAVTLDEALAIQEAEETLKRTQLAYLQGAATALDVQKAEADLAKARKDSTSTDTDEVREAEEQLADMRERQQELPRLLADAELALASAQLAVVTTQLALIESGRELIQQGPAALRYFRQVARAAGLSKDEINALIREYADIPKQQALTAPANLAADITTIGYQPLTGPWATLFDSGMGLAPGLPNYSGITYPGYIPPQIVYPQTSPAFSITGPGAGQVNVFLTVEGVLDLTDPTQVNTIVDVIEDTLISRGIGNS